MGLRAAVESSSSLSVAGLVSEPSEITGFLDDSEADVILVDADWLGPDPAFDFSRLPPTLALVDLDEVGVALRHGVAGVIGRDATQEEMTAAIVALAAGLTVVDSRFRDALGIGSAEVGSSVRLVEFEPLSGREREVLERVARGLPNKAIALELGISEHTVKFHVASLLAKLNAGSRTEALAHAMQAGLLKL
jgi:DNA-binding NarL/FixJ family response regulator